MALVGPNNAIAWAHFRMRGGWKRACFVAVGAFALLGAAVMISARADPGGAVRALATWTQGLLMLQFGAWGIFATMRVSTCVRQDVQSRLIESHRMMPMSAVDAIAGYVLGPTTATLIFSTAIFFLGLATAQGAGYSISQWVLANGIGLILAICVWICSVFATLAGKNGPAALIVPIFVLPSIVGSGGLTAIPAISVILTPLIAQNIFDIRSLAGGVPAELAIGLAVVAAFTTVFFFAAARKFRSDAALGLDTTLGLIVLALYVGTTLTGMRAWQDFRPRIRGSYDAPPEVQIAVSIGLGMLVALITLSAIAWEQMLWRRHEILRDPGPMRRPLPVEGVVAACMIALLLIPFGPPGSHPAIDQLPYTAIVIAITLAGCYFLFAFLYAASPRAMIPMFIWLVLSWGVPVMIDVMRYELMESGEPNAIGGIASCSPIGSLVIIWRRYPLSPLPGIAMMAAINAIPIALWLMLMQRRRRARARLVTNETDSHTPS